MIQAFECSAKGERTERRKFDVRQWVLVTNFEPLCIHVFSSAYLRICSAEFSLNDYADVYRHVSNYSIQKRNQQPNAPLVSRKSVF